MDNHKDILRKIVTQVLNDWAMMLANPIDVRTPPPSGSELIQSSISFSGDYNGDLKLVASEGLCHQLATNVLGLDDDSEHATINIGHEALNELINVICGHLLTEVFGRDLPIEMTIPKAEKIDEQNLQEIQSNSDAIGLLIDSEIMFAGLDIR